MNPSNLTARHTRQPEEDFAEPRPALASSSVDTPGSHDTLSRGVELDPDADFVTEGEPSALQEEIHRLRLALAQLLARETGQDIRAFRGPVVDNHRLCTIADNLWNHRRWSS